MVPMSVVKGIAVIGLFGLAFVLGAATTDSESAYADVETSITPTVCLDAIETAETGFQYASDALTASQDGFRVVASGTYDVNALDSALDDLMAANAGLESIGNEWHTSKTECRESAQ